MPRRINDGKYIPNTRQCPGCQTWILLPNRQWKRFWLKHLKACDDVTWKRHVALRAELIGMTIEEVEAEAEEAS